VGSKIAETVQRPARTGFRIDLRMYLVVTGLYMSLNKSEESVTDARRRRGRNCVSSLFLLGG
jgi:hypothetical protein